ncbi:hypothetical protein [Wenyingzhuangia marina]|uniref:Peptidylprolyl isomerase n=1 Tax=Wenyingzhuangia marina TaxID=1195760 RepID=A0A1M5WRV2_9FLAO|nr:hypothetical protein [Wenyingzhuangia marina]GGF80287.1 hypothetical protein GCM10011397_24090 [Wenyingzhuangia marina]SHH90240.1 hypothetical protein SAMN05444281_2622 [Wenyingzhuangia marina]
MKHLLALIGFLFLIACHQNKTTATNVVAKVYDFTLTKDDLKNNLPKTNSIVDSLKVTQEYIQNWAKQKLLYRNAKINLDNTKELDELVSKYKEELYVTYYKNALVNKKLDTLVFQNEIDSFYVKHKESFKLNETLIKFKYIHIDSKNRKRYNIKKLFLSDEADDKSEILTDYKGFDDYFFKDSVWVSLKDVYFQKPEFPVLSDWDLKSNNKLIEKTEADKSVYYIYIRETLNNGDIAPLEYVKPTIKNILLQKNKLKFFDQMEQILIDDAVKQKKYEVR